jgi:DNA-binding transcriptional ArsR family regulator
VTTNRGAGVVRVLRLIVVLNSCAGGRWLTVYELARHLDVSVRTVRRDFNILRELGAQLLVDPERWPGEPIAIRYRGIRWSDARTINAIASIAKPLGMSEVA